MAMKAMMNYQVSIRKH